MRSQKYYLSFNLTLSYCYDLKVSRSVENHLGFDHMLDQMSALIICLIPCWIACLIISLIIVIVCLIVFCWSVWSSVYLCFCRQEAPPAGISTRSEPQFSISWTNGRAGDDDDDDDDGDDGDDEAQNRGGPCCQWKMRRSRLDLILWLEWQRMKHWENYEEGGVGS